MKNIFLIILIFFTAKTLFAQRMVKTEANADLVEYTSRDGLPTTNISKIVQTNDGYLWISGIEGTYRFDGYQYDEVGKEYGVPQMQNIFYDSTQNMLYFASPKKFITFDGSIFKVYGEKEGYKINGLPGQQIALLKKDSKGRIWIGSFTSFVDREYNGGLTKFKNGSFTVFDSLSFPLHNAVNFIETPYGDLIFSSGGSNTLSGQDGYIALFKEDSFMRIDQKHGVNLQGARILDSDIVNAIDNKGNTWIAFYGIQDKLLRPIKNTTGVIVYDGRGFHQFPGLQDNLKPGQGIASVAFSNEGNKVLATTFFKTDEAMGANPVYELKDKRWEPSNFLKDLPVLHNIKTNETIKGFRFFNSVYSRKNKYFPELLNLASTSNIGESTKYPHQIFTNKNGKWQKYDAFNGSFAGELDNGYLIKTLKGFSVYNPDKSKMFTKSDGLLYDESSTPSMYPDRNGLVWLTYSSTFPDYLDIREVGVNVWDGKNLRSITEKDGIASNIALEIFQDSKDRIWITTAKGITRIKEFKNNDGEWLFRLENLAGDKQKTYNVSRIIETKNGEIFTWQNNVRPDYGNFGPSSFYLARLEGDRFIEYESPFDEDDKKNKFQFYDLIETHDGKLLMTGLFADKEKELTSVPTKIKVLKNGKWSSPPKSWQQPAGQLSYVGALHNGTYFLTVGGFYNFDGNRFINLSDSVNAHADFRLLKSASVAGTFTNIQATERLYIRLRFRGLAIFDGTHLNFYTMKDGLPSANIYNPNPDIFGNLVFSHPSGALVIRGEKFQSIYDDESVASGGGTTAALDGFGNVLMLYRGVGLYIRNLEHKAYPLMISSVSVDTATWFYNYPGQFTHNQNSVLINYAALNFRDPKGTNYEHILEGYETEWSRPGNLSFSEYQNLPAGDYIFRVRGTTANGAKTNEASYSFKINPPLWATWWAYILYVLAFGLILLGVRRSGQNRMYKKQQAKLEKERSSARIKEAELKTKASEAERKALEIENDRKSKELEEARQLQLSMLPKELPKLPHLDIAVYMQTATEVGGDYYDFHVGLDGTLTVVIGDATGHGMKAGTMVTATKSLFNSYAPNPDILFSFREITRCIKQLNMGKTSMCLTMLKIKGDKMQMSTAGMPPSFIFRDDTKVVEEHLFKAMPLGTMLKFPYEVKDTVLKPGDTILLMSDGLPELLNQKEEMYGYKRIRNGFEDVAEKSPEEIISFLKDEGSAWNNNQAPDDDVTFVVIKVK